MPDLVNDFNLSNPILQKTKYGLGCAQQFGLTIESHIQSELTERGYDARLLVDFSAPFDILVNDALPIEVKGAKPTKCHDGRQLRTRWQFCLQGGLDYMKQDYAFILVLVDANSELFTYIIPSAHVNTRQIISITSHPTVYSGMWGEYRDRWDYIDQVLAWRTKYQQSAHGQLSLFSEVL